MPLTSRDETDLLLPLYTGMRENPALSTFLERVRRRTGAEYVTIFLRLGDDHSTQLFAGRDLRALARETGTRELLALEKVHYDRLRPGRVYSGAEFVDHDPVYRAGHEGQLRKLGIADQRVIRLIAEDRFDAWMVIARAVACTASDSALLSNLAPYVREAILSIVRTERREVELAINAQGLARSGTGWLLFDRDARLLAAEPGTIAAFAALALAPPRTGERLRDLSHAAERALVAAAAAFSDNPAAPPRAQVLRDHPRIEALLTAPGPLPVTTLQAPVMLALLRLPRAPSSARAGHLAMLHGLPRREAELAVALSDGQSIAEAAQAMGLTLETARNYSKRLYAQLGVRGQTGLVRLVSSGGTSLA